MQSSFNRVRFIEIHKIMTAETDLLTLMLTYPNQVGEILSLVSSDKFVEQAHIRLAVEKIEAMSARGEVISEKGVYNALEREIGKELTDMVNDDVLASGAQIENLEIYAQDVVNNWTSYELVRMTGEFTAAKLEEAGDSAAFIAERIAQLNTILQKSVLEEEQAGDTAERVVEEIYQRVKDGEEEFNLTGLPSVDSYLKFSRFDLIDIVAPAKAGKTALVGAIVNNCVETRKPFFYVSAELDDETLVKKLVAVREDIPTDLLSTAHIKDTPGVAKRVARCVAELKALPGTLVKSHDLSIPYVVKMCHYYKIKYGTSHFIFDRVDLFTEVTGARDEFAAIRMISRTLRNLARKLEIYIVLVFQAGNTANTQSKGRAQAHHAWGGVASQADCTRMLAIYNPHPKDRTVKEFQAGPFKDHDCVSSDGKYYFAEISVVLNTIGGTGSAKVAFDPDTQKFHDMGIQAGLNQERSLAEKLARYEEGGYAFDPEAYKTPDISEFETVPNPKSGDDEDIFGDFDNVFTKPLES